MKVALSFLIGLLLAGCDRYDSYGECMYDYDIEARIADNMCPGCNDRRANNKKADLRCLKYMKPWEW